MGQQQSAEKAERAEKVRKSEAMHSEKDKRVNARPIPVMSHGRSSPADPSATTASATAQTSHQLAQKPNLQQYLQSQSPELGSKGKVERSSSRESGSAGKKRDAEPRVMAMEQRSAAVPMPSPSGPMDVPSTSKGKYDDFDDQYNQRNYPPISSTRPPRLPLPIAGVAPDSPILQPVDAGNEDVSLLEPDDPNSAIYSAPRRKYSTDDEDDVGDELQPYAIEETSSELVPTPIHWNQSGEKVYVTGTFANYEKKFRLHHNENGEPGMTAIIRLPPGTHHLMFLVDDQGPRISRDMPTAVNFSNILVNYIEISSIRQQQEREQRERRESSQKPAAPTTPLVSGAQPAPAQGDELEPEVSSEDTPGEFDGTEEPFEEEIPMGDFRQLTPQYLVDMEFGDEPKGVQANQIIDDTPGPPVLPTFLSRSILNGTLPLKDDSSVLTLPNHTVLNHLATSSVRNGVLATSVTTRYKKKYVTTIMYKPVPLHRPMES